METTVENTTPAKKLLKKRIILAVLLILSGLGIFITLILMDFCPFGISKIQKLTGDKLIDMYFFYSGERLYTYLGSFNDEALKTLLLVHGIDYVFMTSVVVFEVTILIIISQVNYKALFVTTFALLEFLFDLSENFLVDLVVRKLPEKASMLSGLCGGMTICKWIFTILYLVGTSIILVKVLLNKINKRKTSNISLEANNGVEENTELNQNSESEQVFESNDDVSE